MNLTYFRRSILRISATTLPLLLISLPALTVRAQESRATLNGRVQDVSHAAIPNATVTALNTATGVPVTTHSSDSGDYTIPFLTPGPYVVSADAPGFKTAKQANVILHVGDTLALDLSLPVGEVSETVTVTGAPPLLDDAATRGELIDNVRVEELPIIGRNPLTLANLVPGVVFNGNQSFQRPFDNGDNANFSVNGGLRQTNGFLIDGAPDDAYSDTAGDRSHANQNVAFIPSAEVVQEFKVVSNFYDAQYGRTGGGIFNIITKNGTNNYHGSLYYFLQRYQFNANNVGNKFNHQPIYAADPITKKFLAAPQLDQYGGEVSGPVRIPKLYNGKDKTFFLFGVEQYNENTPSPGLTGTITAAERGGDFSQSGQTVYDPYTTRLKANGTCCTRDPFPGNIIPVSRLTGAGTQLANAFPAPNTPSATSKNNYNVGANLSLDRYRTWIGRLDQNFGQKERVYVRYAHGRRNQTDQGSQNYPLPLLDAQDPLARVNDNAVIDSLTAFNPHITMDIRGSFTRYNETVDRSRVLGYDDTKLGFSSAFSGSRFVPVPPRLSFQSIGGVSLPDAGTRGPRFGISNTIALQPSVLMAYGRHSIHVGADLRDFDYNTGGGSFVYGGGQFSFTSNFTQQDPTASSSPTQGSPVASLLLGAPSSGIIQYTPRLGYRWRYYAAYVQDDFKLSNRLTIDAGLRYDIEGSPHEIANRQNRGFAFNQASPLASVAASSAANCPACASLKGGLLFSGSNGQPTSAFNTQYGHIQPRIGVVFRAYPDTIFRGGYALFYLPESAFGAAQGFSQDTAYIANNSTAPGATIVDQYRPRGNDPNAEPLNNPFSTGIIQPTGSSLGLSTFQGQSIIFNNVNRKIPHVDQFSFGMEQQLPYAVKVDLSYVGSRTRDVNTNDNQAGGARNLNVLSNAQLGSLRQAAIAAGFVQSSGIYAGTANLNGYLSQPVTNPFAGSLPGTNLNGKTISRQQLLLPYPQFLGLNYGQESVGQVWYDSAQLSIEKRYSHGFTILGSYTWSKTEEALAFLNNQDTAPFKNIAAQDRPQRLVISAVYELPIGRGHNLLGNDNRAVELLVGGWQLSLQETIQSGAPVGLNGNYALLADPRIGVNRSKLQYFNTCTRQSSGKLTGNCGATNIVAWQQINSTEGDLRQTAFQSGFIRNPSAPIGNVSASKRFNFTDSVNAQFRFEAFNATNTYIPNGPDTNPASSTFGTISGGTSAPNGQSNIPRIVQLGFKLNF